MRQLGLDPRKFKHAVKRIHPEVGILEEPKDGQVYDDGHYGTPFAAPRIAIVT